MAITGLIGGAGLLLALQPTTAAQNAAAGEQPSEAPAGQHHHTPVYDIAIQNKNFPKEVPVFIEVCVTRSLSHTLSSFVVD